ncbi:MAG TPA: hypothetical protein VFV98_12115 [Vicinamibacterales bacterium]|nr:hypothetical protein [Vicinamibacterales bacterium]
MRAELLSASRRPRRLGVILMLLCASSITACGKKGDPLPPLRPIPGRITDLAATRSGDRIELRFTIPAENLDRTTPSAIDRVEIYAAPVAAGAVPLTAEAVVGDAKRLRARVPVKPPASETPPANATPDPRPARGETGTFVDSLDAATAGAAAVQYVAFGVTPGRGRSGPATMVTVPLANPPAPPQDLKPSYDEKTLTLAWTAAAGESYRVIETSGSGPAPASAPLPAPPFTQPVDFSREKCFAVLALTVTDRVTVEGPASTPVCVTPKDTFAPPAPTGLNALQDGAAITLVWTGVEAPDLAGYMVLRRDGASETLRPLNPAPLTATTFRDEQAQAGATYTYSVVAVDKLGNPSEQSNRQTITVR